MQSLDVSTAEGAGQAPAGAVSPITTAWVLRRAALWLFIVAAGIALSCLLYMAASQAEAESAARPTDAQGLARPIKS